MRSCFVAILALVIGACAAAPPPAPAAPTLAYALPGVNPASYLVADTTRILVRAPGDRTIETVIAVRSRATIGVHVDSAGMLASVRLDSLTGDFAVAGEASVVLDSADVPVDAVLLRLSPAGADSVIVVPGFSAALTRVVGGASFMQHLFVPLPGGPTAFGAVWTDTLTMTEEDAGVRSTTRAIVVSSLAGDTLVDGRTLRVIASNISMAIDVSGVVDGLEVTQRLTGEGNARTLWDDERALLVWREEHGTARGTMDLPALGASAVPVEATIHRTVRLLP